MTRLCKNRPDGFGPHSTLHSGLPTTCFLDVIVEPLPTWLLLIAMAVLLPMRIKAWRNDRAYSTVGKRRNLFPSDGKPKSIISRCLSGLYYAFLFCLVAMATVEIARLAIAELGIGLLPFQYIGLMIVTFNRITWRSRTARIVNICFWVLSIIATALKVAAEQKEQDSPVRRVKDTNTQGKYPTSDEVLDNAVILGVQIVQALLEFNGWSTLGVRDQGKYVNHASVVYE